jgi:hypothetical protein
MIQDIRQIQIEASPERIYRFIETAPNKFPIYRFLEKKFWLFLRILFVDGLRSATRVMGIDRPEDVMILEVGDSMGPFTLTEAKRPFKYWFAVRSFFINCETGYLIYSKDSPTILHFHTIMENPRFREKIWWFLIKPIHIVFANKVLRTIKEKIEDNE